ncbi:hypothetical protein [Ideonella livida]|uniref:Uncharacterized protein n=1 Tax=Ideonella livida TaxID=2707176 RepID=A0A7C9PH65_9BURK|nr:hypothetical protein [Ideonella livida]NDY91252.1 hypothetical protein [Ideonella livida]
MSVCRLARLLALATPGLLAPVAQPAPLLDPLRTPWQPDRMSGLVYCVPATGGQPCHVGTLRERRWDTSGSIALGKVNLPCAEDSDRPRGRQPPSRRSVAALAAAAQAV